jgi:hypothetical protein
MYDVMVMIVTSSIAFVFVLVAMGIAYATGVKKGEINITEAHIKSIHMEINLREYICDIGMRLDFEDWLSKKYADNENEENM